MDERIVASEWEKLGILSFARFYNLTMEETIFMINNPNDTLCEMMTNITQSMIRWENFMVKVKKVMRIKKIGHA